MRRAIDDLEFADAAVACGYNRLVVQRGAGETHGTRGVVSCMGEHGSTGPCEVRAWQHGCTGAHVNNLTFLPLMDTWNDLAGAYVPHNLVKEGQNEGVTAKGLEVRSRGGRAP